MGRYQGVLQRAVILSLLALSVPGVPAQAPPTRPSSTPYTGDLSIFETPGREDRLQINRVMDLLGIHEGSSVADIGAGSGWFTVRAAARVGASGAVYAEDINPDAIDYIKKRAKKAGLANVHTVLGTPDDPDLPAHSVDAVLMLKSYHEIANTTALLAHLTPALKPGATIGIIDRNGDGTDHGLMPDVVKREMERAGFREVASYDFTKADGQDYFLIFKQK
jgi:ubiquinone/menaquinone biosynthesis C-methylase UbiE